MAQENFQMPPLGSETQADFLDAEGNTFESFRATDEITRDEHGQRIHRVWHEAHVTADRFIFHPGLLKANPPVYVGQCGLCPRPPWTFPSRRQPTTGLVTMANAVHCGRCGLLLCTIHRREVNGSFLCINCARKSAFWRLLDWMFFAREREP